MKKDSQDLNIKKKTLKRMNDDISSLKGRVSRLEKNNMEIE